MHQMSFVCRAGVFVAWLLALSALAPSAVATPLCGSNDERGVVVTSGTVVEDGIPGTFVRNVGLGSGRSRELVDFGVIKRGSGFDGRSAWSQDVSGATHTLNSEFAKALARSEAWLDVNQGCPPATGPEWAALGRKAEGPKTFDAREVTPPGGAPIELWYDPATHRLDRAIFQQAESRLVRHFDDWRLINGDHLVAFTWRDQGIEDQSELVYHVTSATVRRSVGRKDFSRPADPNDAKIRGDRPSTEIAYDDDNRTRIYVPVYLNGRGPFTFELDSGGHFILDAPTAEALGLVAEGSFSATGAGIGVARVGYVRVKELRIGDAVISDQPANVRTFSFNANDRGAKPPRAGIIGLELFERFTVGIDRQRKVVSLRLKGQPYREPQGQALPLLFDEDAPLVRGAIHGIVGNLMLDTGNAGSTIVEDFWAQKNGLVKQLSAGPSDGEVRYTSGAVTIGSTRLAGETMAYYGPAERGSEYTRSVAAILGEPLLSRLDAVYDYARGLVWLAPVDGVLARPFDRMGLKLAKAADGNFTVDLTLPGSAAELAGLKKGDVITEIAGRAARLLSRADAGSIFKQAPGTMVQMELISSGSPPRQVEVALRDLL